MVIFALWFLGSTTTSRSEAIFIETHIYAHKLCSNCFNLGLTYKMLTQMWYASAHLCKAMKCLSGNEYFRVYICIETNKCCAPNWGFVKRKFSERMRGPCSLQKCSYTDWNVHGKNLIESSFLEFEELAEVIWHACFISVNMSRISTWQRFCRSVKKRKPLICFFSCRCLFCSIKRN